MKKNIFVFRLFLCVSSFSSIVQTSDNPSNRDNVQAIASSLIAKRENELHKKLTPDEICEYLDQKDNTSKVSPGIMVTIKGRFYRRGEYYWGSGSTNKIFPSQSTSRPSTPCVSIPSDRNPVGKNSIQH